MIRLGRSFWISFILPILASACMEAGSDSTSGQGGSMTRFAISGTYLYIATKTNIIVYDISQDNFARVRDVEVGFDLETIFARGEYLYLGSQVAMHIYSIADRSFPKFIFLYTHLRSCDPVVVQGNRAYVTLHTSDECLRGENALEIIDITNPNNPRLVNHYPMTSPLGLGIDGDCLFVCEGSLGLRVFKLQPDDTPQLIAEINDVHAYDVIPRNGILTLTGEDGIFQYQYNCQAQSLQLLSKIPVLREEI